MTARARLGLAMMVVAFAAIVLSATAPLRQISGDTAPARYGAAVLRCAGSFDLRRVDWIKHLAGEGSTLYFMYPDRTGEYTSIFGPAPAVIGALGFIDVGAGDRMSDHEFRVRERLVAAFLVALAAALVVLAAAARCSRRRATLAGLVAVASFAGAATVGQALWQATTALPCLAAALAALAWRDRCPRLATLATPALLVLAAMLRPTIAPLAGGLGLVWLVHARPRSPRMWAAAVALVLAASAPLVVWNAIHLHSPFPIGQWKANKLMTEGSVFSPWHVARGIAGLVASPGRGLVWYAPILVVGVVRGLRAADRTWRFAAVGIVLQLVAMATFFKWHGGQAYGPRLLAEATWVATFLALGAFAERTPAGPALGRRLAAVAVGVTCVIGLLGLYLWRPEQWERRRIPDVNPDAFWDVVDSPLASLLEDTTDRPIANDSAPIQGLQCYANGMLRTF